MILIFWTNTTKKALLLGAYFVTLLPGCPCMHQPVHLATIDYFSNHEIVLGDEVKIYGEGFISGDVEIVFDGRWKVRGEHPRSGIKVFEGTAASENEIFFVMQRDAFEDLCASHVLFEGRVVVRMETSSLNNTGYIDAVRERMKFDVLDLEPNGKRVCPADEERVRDFLAELGLWVEEREEPGVRVAKVAPQGKASSAGLKEDDIIFVSGGMKVYTGEDILPAPDAQRLSMVVFRSGEEKLLNVDVSIKAREAGVDTKRNILIAAAFALIVLLLQSRWVNSIMSKTLSLRLALRRKTDKGGGEVKEEGEGNAAPEPAAAGEAGSEKLLDRLTALLFSLIIVFPFVAVVSMALFRYGHVMHSTHACGVVFVIAFTAFFGETRKPGGFLSSTVRRMITGFLMTLPLILVFALRWLKTSSPMVMAAGEGQVFYPWTWNGFQEPFSLILLFCGFLSAAVPERRRTPWRRHIIMHIYSITMLALMVHAMMGGFEVPLFVQTYPEQKAAAISILIFMSKILVIYFALQAVPARGEQGYSPSVINASLIAVISLLAFIASLLFAPAVAGKIHNLQYYTTVAAFFILFLMALISNGRQKVIGPAG